MRVGFLITLLLLAACGSDDKRGGSVTVFATEEDPADLTPLFAAYTEETGTRVDVVFGASSANADAMIEKRGVAPDVLITANIGDIWRAADQGALRPLTSQHINKVATTLRDPDKLWVSLQRRYAVIAMSAANTEAGQLDYSELAKSAYSGRVCLTALSQPINQAVIAMLIEDRGVKPAERVVRGWVRNLAAPPFATEIELLAAIQTGQCEFGIVSETVLNETFRSAAFKPMYAQASAMGVARHAQNPDAGQHLVDWLIATRPAVEFDNSNERNIGLVGWRAEEVRLLAERAGYR